jgi:GNAT superfamily N-acetyltransferase
MEAARPATASDLGPLCELAGEARAGLAHQRGGRQRLLELRPPDEDHEALQRLLASPDALVAVGTWDGLVVAYAVAERSARRDGTAVARVDELYVQPPARQVGVGEMVMDLVMAWAREAGCEAVEAVALPGDRLTKNFFERFGLTARAIVVARTLPTDA